LFGFAYEKAISLFFLLHARKLHEKCVVDSIGNLPNASQFTSKAMEENKDEAHNKVVALILPHDWFDARLLPPTFHNSIGDSGKIGRGGGDRIHTFDEYKGVLRCGLVF
jgi:hypothetical protein